MGKSDGGDLIHRGEEIELEAGDDELELDELELDAPPERLDFDGTPILDNRSESADSADLAPAWHENANGDPTATGPNLEEHAPDAESAPATEPSVPAVGAGVPTQAPDLEQVEEADPFADLGDPFEETSAEFDPLAAVGLATERPTREVELPAHQISAEHDPPPEPQATPVEVGELDLALGSELDLDPGTPWQEEVASGSEQDPYDVLEDDPEEPTAGAYFMSRKTSERPAIKAPIRSEQTAPITEPSKEIELVDYERSSTSTSFRAIALETEPRLPSDGPIEGFSFKKKKAGRRDLFKPKQPDAEIHQADTNPGLHAVETRPGAGSTGATLEGIAAELRKEAAEASLTEDDWKALAEAMDEVASKLESSTRPAQHAVPPLDMLERWSPPSEEPNAADARIDGPLSRTDVPLPPPKPIIEMESEELTLPVTPQSRTAEPPAEPLSAALTTGFDNTSALMSTPTAIDTQRSAFENGGPRSVFETGRYDAVMPAEMGAGVELDHGRYDTSARHSPEEASLSILETGRYDMPSIPLAQQHQHPGAADPAASAAKPPAYSDIGRPLDSGGAEPARTGPYVPLDFSLDSTTAEGELELASDLALDSAASEKSKGTVYEGPAGAEHEEGEPAQVSSVRAFFSSFEKALRVYNLYEGRGESCTKALQNAAEQLKDSIVSYGEFTVRVTPYELIMGNSEVFTSDEERHGVTYRLFRDGLRELTFKRGVTADEIGALIDVVRVVPGVRDEDDSVTRLWEKNLQGIEYRATDMFLEGMIDGSTTTMQQEIDTLVAAATAPLSSAPVAQDVPDSEPARLNGGLLRELGAMQDLSAFTSLEGRFRGVLSDIWRRAMMLAFHLSTAGQDNAAVLNLVARLLEQLLERERWEMLAAAAQSMKKMADQAGEEGQKLLDAALAPLCVGNRLMILDGPLSGDSPASEAGQARDSLELFRQLKSFLMLLPEAGNDALVRLLSRMPRGEAQDELAATLAERGLDLVDYHRQRLKDPNNRVLLAAIEALADIGGAKVQSALREALAHKDSRAQVAALRALAGQIQRADSTLTRLLRSPNAQVRELTFGILEEATPDSMATSVLHDIVSNEEFDAWKPPQINRARQLVVRWGGPRLDELVLKTLSASNPFRRKRVEERRQEMFEAVQRVGGDRARELLEACVARKLPDAIRSAIELALARLKS
jgi:hypothetical protein